MSATDAKPRVPDGLEGAAARGMAVAFHAAAAPDRVALVSPHCDRTYGALNDRTNRVVRALRRRGLGAGDAVALLCTNRPEFVEVYLATQRAGMRLTPVNWHLTGPEAGYIVGDCDAKGFIADARFADVAVDAARGAPALVAHFAIGGPVEGFE